MINQKTKHDSRWLHDFGVTTYHAIKLIYIGVQSISFSLKL